MCLLQPSESTLLEPCEQTMHECNVLTTQTLKEITEKCISCGLCFKECEALSSLNLSPATIAVMLLTKQDYSADFIRAIQKCSLCERCDRNCPLGLSPKKLMLVARRIFISQQLVNSNDYRMMHVDQEHHLFSLYRNTWEIDYQKYRRKPSRVLFFPGCTLSCFAPQLTQMACNWLSQQGHDISLSEQCCGLPLESIGLFERHVQYINRLENDLNSAGAKQIITACPNCFYHLQGKYEGIEVRSLYQLMVDAGIKIPAMAHPMTIHDSCPDRHSGQIGRSMRALLNANRLVEMPHHNEATICCGAGGLVSMIDPQFSNHRTAIRLEEIRQSSSDYCISSCMGCVKRLESVQAQQSKNNADNQNPLSQLRIFHILELVFDLRINHDQLQQRLDLMWQDDRGEKNVQKLQQN